MFVYLFMCTVVLARYICICIYKIHTYRARELVTIFLFK